MSPNRLKYNAFISYSHSSDKVLAPIIQSALHKFAKPWYRLRQLNIYRDQTNLSISPELWPTIQKALQESEYFLFFASPQASTSKWVKREISWWIENKPIENLLIILTGGDIFWDDESGDFNWSTTTSLPDTLSGKFKYEPNFVDFRDFHRDNLNLRDPLFLENILSIAAPLNDKNKEELGGEDVRQHRFTKMLTWIVGTAIILVSIIAIWQFFVANNQKREALNQASIALARQLAAQSEVIRASDVKNLPLAVSLAIEALNIHLSEETDRAAWEAITLMPQLVHESSSSSVTQIKFTRDGEMYATSGSDSLVIVAETVTNQVVLELKHTDKVWDVDFSSDGNFLAMAGDDGLVGVFDLKTKKPMAVFEHLGPVRNVVFSPDNQLLATASEDNTAGIWDLRQKSRIASIPHSDIVWRVAFSHDGKFAATAGRDEKSILWNVERRQKKHTFQHKDVLWSVAFSLDDRILLTTSEDRSAMLWNTSTGKPIKKLEHSDRVMAATFSPDSSKIVTSSWDNTIKIWSAKSLDLLSTINSGGIVFSMSISPDSKYILAGGRNTAVWDMESSRQINRLYLEYETYNTAFGPNGLIGTSDVKKGRIWRLSEKTRKIIDVQNRSTEDAVPMVTRGWCVAISPKKNSLVIGYSNNIVYQIDLDDKKIKNELKHNSFPTAIIFNHDGSIVATADSFSIKTWDAKTGRLLWEAPFKSEVNSLDFSLDGRFLAVGSDLGLTIFDSALGKLSYTTNPMESVHFLAFTNDSRSLVFFEAGGILKVLDINKQKIFIKAQCSDSKSVKITGDRRYLNVATETGVKRFSMDELKLTDEILSSTKLMDVAESPGNKTLAFAGDSTITIVDLRTHVKVLELRQKSEVLAVEYDRTGKYLAIGCVDGTIHVRAADSGTEVSSITWNPDVAIQKLSFSADGRYIIGSNQRYRTATWLWNSTDAIQTACNLLPFMITRSQWDLFLGSRDYRPVCSQIRNHLNVSR